MEKIVFVQYLVWQFIDSPRAILKAWKNFLFFNLNYFSIPTLLRTFFSHWKRYSYSYGKSFNIGRYFEAFTFNAMSRVIGAILRTFVIIIGLIVEVILFLAGAIIVLGWIFLPFILIYGLIYGFKLISS